MKIITDKIMAIMPKPRLIVFDLDETLWSLGIDDYYYLPPYKRIEKIKSSNENQRAMYKVVDRVGKVMDPYKEVNSVLHFLDKEVKIPLAVASRTSDPKNANHLLDLFNWSDYFQYKEIYPGQKFKHFENFKQQSKIPYKDMLFFDNEDRNIRDISSINVTCVLVDSEVGMNFEYLKQGFEEHVKKLTKEQQELEISQINK